MQIKKLLNILNHPIFLFLNLEAWLQLCKSFCDPGKRKLIIYIQGFPPSLTMKI